MCTSYSEHVSILMHRQCFVTKSTTATTVSLARILEGMSAAVVSQAEFMDNMAFCATPAE